MTLVQIVREELVELRMDDLALWLQGLAAPPLPDEAAERFWEVFAPDSAGLLDSWGEQVTDLRDRRLISIDMVDGDHPDGHILFTSNVLLTSLDTNDEPRWHFDHPMVIGADIASNEIVHGLVGLNAAIAFEKDRGTVAPSTTVDCALTVSVTHECLESSARAEVYRSIAVAGDLENLAVYVFTEADAQRLAAEVLAPTIGCDPSILSVFGVSGSYGRHYSFGKALAALWREVVDNKVDRTFKFDLDQVFPQEQLVTETGRSALELLTMGDRWGASGIDSFGNRVDLGMCAGALVNQSAIHRGLFTADVAPPATPITLPDLMFCKTVPQALSTEAEMMDSGGDPPGAVRQRIHVTGGTTGITVDALTRYRPFTPSFIERAEDQAYLMSVLDSSQPCLRTVHMPGLFMRHDKESVAHQAVRSARISAVIGDYERTILFTGYARVLGIADTTRLGPFTGSYINDAPLAVTLIKLMLDIMDRAHRGDDAAASQLLSQGVNRVARAYDLAIAPGNELRRTVASERASWDRYYDAIAALRDRPDLCGAAAEIIESTRMT